MKKLSSPTRFHWALPVEAKKTSESQADRSGGVDLDRLVEFVRLADETGIESLLTPFGFHMPDPFPLLGMLSGVSKRVGFLLAYRSGLMSPTLFVQQVNTLSQLLPGRLNLNMVAGFSPDEQAFYGDHLSHDERYERADEFLEVADAFWRAEGPVTLKGKHFDIRKGELKTLFSGGRPRISISGNSKIAQSTAMRRADCWLRYADTVESVAACIEGLPQDRSFGVGLRLSIVSGKTRGEALENAAKVVANPDENWKAFLKAFVQKCDSVAVRSTFDLAGKNGSEWLSPYLWSGAVPFRGGPALALVGTHQEIADELFRYRQAGVSEFILSGWPTEVELENFSTHILGRYRRNEAALLKTQEARASLAGV